MKQFTKNDSGFECVGCGHTVPPLLSSSRDHCNKCLYSLHVDINPGDRENTCGGILQPINISIGNKGYIIEYRCQKCGETIHNKAAPDDNFDTIVMLTKLRTYSNDIAKNKSFKN